MNCLEDCKLHDRLVGSWCGAGVLCWLTIVLLKHAGLEQNNNTADAGVIGTETNGMHDTELILEMSLNTDVLEK